MSQDYSRKLDPISQAFYQMWLEEQGRARGRDLSRDTEDYDLQGYWQDEGWYTPSGGGHGPDTYKKPNHPTFSDESIYNMTPNVRGGLNLGGSWGQDDSFTAGPTNRENWTLEDLLRYFDQVEPGTKLRYGR